jgi:GcrA cell cycle regulator
MDMSTVPPTRKKVARRKTLLDLEARDCRWPIGEPRNSDFHFCGARAAEGRPYCVLHWGMAFQPPRPRNQRLALQPPTAVPALPTPSAKAA